MQRYSTFFRLISIILTVALLMTTTTFSILAAEAAEAIGELAADLSAGQENPETAEIAESERLGDLLRRLNEYDSFTDAEKKLVLSALGMAVDEESARIAQENQAEQHRLFDAMPYTARCELQIHGWAEDGKTYADLSDTQKQTVLDYLELDHARAAEYAARFAALEAAGYDLFEAMQIMSITKNDLFTLDEAVAIYGHYDARPDRDANVSAFADFATLFDTAYAADTHAKAIAAAQAASRDLSAYLSAAALERAKAMFTAGYSVGEIRAAYTVAAALGVTPASMLQPKDTVRRVKGQNVTAEASDPAAEAFFARYPVNRAAVEQALAAPGAAAAALSVQAAASGADYAVLAADAGEISGMLNPNRFTRPQVSIKYQPFDLQVNAREQINLNSGTLQYKEPLVNVPGLSAALSLSLQYDSGEAQTEEQTYNSTEEFIYGVPVSAYSYLTDDDGNCILLDDQEYINWFYTWEEAKLFSDEYSGRHEDMQVSDGYAITHVKPVEVTWINDCVMRWVENPWLTLENSESNPAPDSLEYSAGGYTGILERMGEDPIKDEYGIEKDPYIDGRPIHYHTSKWKATYSGNVSRAYSEYTVGYENPSDPDAPLAILESEEIYYSSDSKEITYGERRYDLGAGWSFDIPSIDTENNRLILPGIGTFSISGNEILNYDRQDMTLSCDSSYTDGQYPSHRKLTFADGSVDWFAENGVLLAAVDRFGNKTAYTYTESGDRILLAAVEDDAARRITVAYADTAEGRKITVTAPDGTATEIYTKSISDDGDFCLDRIVYASGETTTFSYDAVDVTHSFTGKSPEDFFETDSDLSGTTEMLLTAVTYVTGAKVCYTYAPVRLDLGSYGFRDSHRITARWTEDPAAGTTTDYLAYAYEGTSTGYPNTDDDTAYTYSTGVTEGELVRTYTFNSDGYCTVQEITAGGKPYQRIETAYDTYDLPETVTTKTYGSASVTTVERYTHDARGNVLTHISARADGSETDTEHRTTYTYDARYNLALTAAYKQDANTAIRLENLLTEDGKSVAETRTYVNDVLAARTAYTYDEKGRLTEERAYPNVALDNSAQTVYNYDSTDLRSVTVTADSGTALTTAYTYDGMGRLTAETDARGNTTAYTYDVRGRVTAVTSPCGSVTTYAYDAQNNRTTVTAPGREAVVYVYDAAGRQTGTQYASGERLSEAFYDEHGRLTAETAGDAAAWRATYYAYDARGRVLEKAVFDADDALVSRETCTYDDAASGGYAVVTKTLHGDADAADQTTVTYTDKYGDTVRTDVAGVVTSYAYDYVGNAVRSFYGTTTLAAYTYDFRGNVLTGTDALGNTRSFTYDALGRKTAESDCKGNITTYAYDLAGRLLTVTAPLSDTTDAVTVYTYDANGNVLRTEQTAQADDSAVPTWRTVEQTYDAMNRVTDIAETADATHKVWTHYAYNAAGDLTDVYTGLSAKWSLAVNPETRSHTHYAYDARGRVDTLTDALGQSETYTYDPLGAPLGAVLRDGTTAAYTYSPLGAVTSRIGSMTTGTAYTATGAVAQTTADGETVAYTYNPAGGILTETTGDSVKTYTYDHRGRQASFTLMVGGETVGTTTYAYDLLDRVTAVTADGVETTYTYDANGNRASQTTGAVTTTYTYNKANLVTGMVNILLNDDGEDVVISEFAYTYYADGNQRTKTETLLGGDPVTTAYTYDGLGRLTAETTGEDSITYTYDASGNRIGMNRNGTVTAYAYDANNRLLSETVGDAVTTYTYDANGNTLTAGDKTYTYNDRGQQTGYSNGTTTASYAYNPSGLRKAKTVGGSTKYFVYNGMNIVYEYSESVADGIAYFYGLNRTHNSEGEIYVYNAHGDVVQLVKDNSVVASYTYDAFGNLTSQIGESDNPFLYCGEYFDAETQTYYLRARYYNPANGRFTQQDAWSFMDTSDPLSLNLYTYCFNNPVMYVDPSGCWNIPIFPTIPPIRTITLDPSKLKDAYTSFKTKLLNSGIIEHKALGALMTLTELLVNIKQVNYEINSAFDSDASTTTRDRIVNDQNGQTGDSFYYGLYKAQHNGCETIAVHNAKILLGRSSTLSDTMKDFQDANAMIGAGYFGSNPYAIGKVLQKYGISYKSIANTDAMSEDGVYIMSFWNEGAPWNGLHTVAVKIDGGNCKAYNLNGYNEVENIDLKGYSGRFITAYYVGGM